MSVLHVFKVRVCTAMTISTPVEIATRGLSVVLEGLYVLLSDRDGSEVFGCEVMCEVSSDRR